MTLRLPQSRDEIYAKLSSDVQSNLPTSNPQKEQSWLRAILVGFAGAFFDVYLQIREAINTFFADTTYGEFLEQKAALYKLTRNPAKQAQGEVTFEGTLGVIIPAGTAVINSGNQYTSLTSIAVTEEIIGTDLVTYAGGICTVNCLVAHKFVTGMTVVLSGATPSGLNASAVIKSITSAKGFTFDTDVAGSGTATGTILVTSEKAVVEFLSDGTGAIQNMNANEVVNLSSPIVGINNQGKVTYEGVGGGADIEDDASFRDRLVYRLQNPVTQFNVAQITAKCRELSFVKRVFVQRITPYVGGVTIYFLKDNNEIPNASELAQVKQRIVDTILPAHTSEDDLYVLAPTPVIIDFTIEDLLPNQSSMRTSITNRLTEYFKRQVQVAQSITTEDFITVIKSTIDTETGDAVEDFTVTAPVADTPIASNEIAQLGAVTFV